MASEESKGTLPSVGELCWLEVPYTDIARAAAFYRTVLGWESSGPASNSPLPSAMDSTDGVHMFTNGRLSGAFVKMSKPEGVAAAADAAYPAKSTFLASYYVTSIEETLELVEKAGGRVHVIAI